MTAEAEAEVGEGIITHTSRRVTMSVAVDLSILRERMSNIRKPYIPPRRMTMRVVEELSILRERLSNIRKPCIPPATPDHTPPRTRTRRTSVAEEISILRER